MADNETKDFEESLDIDEENIDGKPETPLNKKEQKKIIRQIEEEYNICWPFTHSKRTEGLRRLKLYNNQKRDQTKVGDPLLFSVFQTVFASLYDDRLAVTYMPREEGDEEVAENLTALAEYDYDLMEKDQLDYEWDWDTCFFGRGLVLLNDFDETKNIMAPVSEVLDPMTFIRDPRASSVNGNQRGFGAARFFGFEFGLTKAEMEKLPGYFNLDKLKKDKDVKSLIDEARQARRDAQDQQSTKYEEEALTENYEYQLMNWFTKVDGEKFLITTANGRKVIIRYLKLESEKWPVIDRSLFPIAHDWDGVSIPDLIEDKQRARAVMINLGMDSAKADLYPMYLYNKKKIKNPRHLDFEFNKYVPVEGDVNNSIVPIQKSLFHNQVNLILNILDLAAQKSVAAPDVAQGIQPGQARTLGETELVAAGSNARRSLSARIFGWSERRFWQQWYFLYKTHFDEKMGEKIVRIEGPLAPSWRKLSRENIIANVDPDVFVESSVISEAKRQRAFREYSTFAQIASQDPTASRRFISKKLGKILRIPKSEMDLIFPPTIDEMRSQDENLQIEDNILPKVKAVDDDAIHIEIHNKAADTPAKFAHIEAHKAMMMAKKENQQLFPPPGQAPPPKFSPVPVPGGERGTRQRLPASVGVRGETNETTGATQ